MHSSAVFTTHCKIDKNRRARAEIDAPKPVAPSSLEADPGPAGSLPEVPSTLHALAFLEHAWLMPRAESPGPKQPMM